jgi:hypothetical protein
MLTIADRKNHSMLQNAINSCGLDSTEMHFKEKG